MKILLIATNNFFFKPYFTQLYMVIVLIKYNYYKFIRFLTNLR